MKSQNFITSIKKNLHISVTENRSFTVFTKLSFERQKIWLKIFLKKLNAIQSYKMQTKYDRYFCCAIWYKNVFIYDLPRFRKVCCNYPKLKNNVLKILRVKKFKWKTNKSDRKIRSHLKSRLKIFDKFKF